MAPPSLRAATHSILWGWGLHCAQQGPWVYTVYFSFHHHEAIKKRKHRNPNFNLEMAMRRQRLGSEDGKSRKETNPSSTSGAPAPAWPGRVTVSRVSSHPCWPGRAGPKVRVSAGVGQTKGKKEGKAHRESPWF